MRSYLGFGNISFSKLEINTADGSTYIGEMSDDNKRHGKGIKITPQSIHIGYFEDGDSAPGKFITIISDGRFAVGESYWDADGFLDSKGKTYDTD